MNDDLSKLISTHQASFTKLERRIAAYLLANPSAIVVDTGGSIAERVEVSPMTVTRFFKKIGFADAAAAKSLVKRQFYGGEASSIDSRFDAFRRSRARPDAYAPCQAAAAAIQRAGEYRQQAIWPAIVGLVADADSVYATGFQTMGYLANGLVQRLCYVRSNVHEMDGSDGVYAKLLTDPAPRKTLIIVDSFRYGRNGPVLAEAARERNADVIIFCDELCDWAAAITPYVVALPSEAGFFFRPTTAVHFILGLLVQDVIDQLGDRVRAQMALLSEAQERFGQYMK
jgi:DNA-binding MurR/RpiR family transcriptional regulator